MTGPAEVRLRPLRTADLDLLEQLLQDPEQSSEYTWYGFGSAAAMRRRLADDGGIGPTGGFLAIEADGQWVGYLAWFPEYYGGAAGSQAWRFGMTLLPTVRGRGIGSAATSQLTEYLFQNTPIRRIETCVDPDNEASRRMLERCGYLREGLLRQAEFRAGRWRDLLIYAQLREDG